MTMTNEKLQSYPFLKGMVEDSYFPAFLVEKGQQILVRLCEQIEQQRPQDETALYGLTHAATNEFNTLAAEFEEHDSEIETVARDCIAMDFGFIAAAYGFNADLEELIATRDW
jgi:hypothetical protein